MPDESNFDAVMASTESAQLAQEHWEYTKGLLQQLWPLMTAQVVRADLEPLLQYLYTTAFEHGYKHGKEQSDDTKG